MIDSIWRIEYHPADGRPPVRLLDYGDRMNAEPRLPCGQDAWRSAPIGARFSRYEGAGHTEGQAEWTRRQTFATPTAARAAVWRLRDAFSRLRRGRLVVALDGGETWEMTGSAVILCAPTIERRIPNALMVMYTAQTGRARPVSEIAIFAGMTPDWINQKPSAIAVKPSAI